MSINQKYIKSSAGYYKTDSIEYTDIKVRMLALRQVALPFKLAIALLLVASYISLE